MVFPLVFRVVRSAKRSPRHRKPPVPSEAIDSRLQLALHLLQAQWAPQFGSGNREKKRAGTDTKIWDSESRVKLLGSFWFLDGSLDVQPQT